MNLDSIVQQLLGFAGTFNNQLLVFLFLICVIGELGITIPYVFETVWLFSGYNLSIGVITPLQLLIMWLMAEAGRQVGALVLYLLSRVTAESFAKLYRRYLAVRFKKTPQPVRPSRWQFLKKINYLSPFSVAMARLLWLRLPLTLTMGAQKKLGTLAVGIVISSIIWDGIYITLGLVVGTRATLQPFQMILFSLGALTLLYGSTFLVRYIINQRRKKKAAQGGQSPDTGNKGVNP